MKPSECTPATTKLITALVSKYLDPDAYVVVNGAVPETRALLDVSWAHIFFTGGLKIGRIIATAAAKFVTPVTLELGGKSPVIISPDYDLELAAKRLLYGKVQNVGQVSVPLILPSCAADRRPVQLCVSPDYVLVPRSISRAFQDALKKVYASFFPTNPLADDSKWGKLINEPHFRRVQSLIEQTRGDIILGGKADDKLRIALTIVAGVKLDDPLMEEYVISASDCCGNWAADFGLSLREIFGPVLPIVEVDDVDEALQVVADRSVSWHAFVMGRDAQMYLTQTIPTRRIRLH